MDEIKYKPNTCETCDRYNAHDDSPYHTCWRCSINPNHYPNIPESIQNFWVPTEWYKAYQKLESDLDDVKKFVKGLSHDITDRHLDETLYRHADRHEKQMGKLETGEQIRCGLRKINDLFDKILEARSKWS